MRGNIFLFAEKIKRLGRLVERTRASVCAVSDASRCVCPAFVEMWKRSSMFLQIGFSFILLEHRSKRLFLKRFGVGRCLVVWAAVSVVSWAVLQILTNLLESLTQFAKTQKLFRRQNTADGEFVRKPDFCHLGLSQLDLFQPGLHVGLIDLIGVYSFIESTIGEVKTLLGLIHHGFSVGVEPANLLDLFTRESELAKRVPANILRLIRPRPLWFLRLSIGRPAILRKSAPRERENHHYQTK